MPTLTTYPFDPTGLLVSNLVGPERKTPATSAFQDYKFIVPDAAPFFKNSMVVTAYPSGTVLVAGIDYFFTHEYYDATVSTAAPVYGSISFFNNGYNGQVNMSYQTVGGAWVLSTTSQLDALYNALLNPRVVYWDQVVNYPNTFPVINHGVNLADLKTSDDVINSINGITQALQQRAAQASTYASAQEAMAGIINNKQMSPLTTALVVNNAILNSGVNASIQTAFLVNINATSQLALDLFGPGLFMETPSQHAFKLALVNGSYVLGAGTAYVGGARVTTSGTTTLTTPTLPSDLYLIVIMPDGLQHSVPTIDAQWTAQGVSLAYNAGGRQYSAVKIATVTVNGITDLRFTQTLGYGLAFNERTEDPTIDRQSFPTKINSQYMCDDSLVAPAQLVVPLPPTIGLRKFQWVEFERVTGTSPLVIVDNVTTDVIKLEKPDGSILVDTSALHNLNTTIRFVWMGSYWSIQ